MRPPYLLELVDDLSFIPRRTVLYPPSYVVDDPAAAAIEHTLTTSPPARPPATVESLDRRAPPQAEHPLGPELIDRITAPQELIFLRRRLRVENDR